MAKIPRKARTTLFRFEKLNATDVINSSEEVAKSSQKLVESTSVMDYEWCDVRLHIRRLVFAIYAKRSEHLNSTTNFHM